MDQKKLSLLNSSLSGDILSETLVCTSARSLWLLLESIYSPASAARVNHLHSDLFNLRKGSDSVKDFARNQLQYIDKPIPNDNKCYWFLFGLGSDFLGFSDRRMAISPLPVFRDLVDKAQTFEQRKRTLNQTPSISQLVELGSVSFDFDHGAWNQSALCNSPKDTSEEDNDSSGGITGPSTRTLPGLLDRIMSKGRRMTYDYDRAVVGAFAH